MEVKHIIAAITLSIACLQSGCGASHLRSVRVPVAPSQAGEATALVKGQAVNRLIDVQLDQAPQSIEEAYAQLQARCAAVEIELDRKIKNDSAKRWAFVSTALASAAASTMLLVSAETLRAGDSSTPDSTINGLRIGGAVASGVAGVFTGISAAVGFEGRLEKRRQSRANVMTARQRAAAYWSLPPVFSSNDSAPPIACTEDPQCEAAQHRQRLELLSDMARTCIFPEVEQVQIDFKTLRREMDESIRRDMTPPEKREALRQDASSNDSDDSENKAGSSAGEESPNSNKSAADSASPAATSGGAGPGATIDLSPSNARTFVH